jgi:hypothetical protein
MHGGDWAMPEPSIYSYVHIWTFINRATMYIVQMYIYIYMKGSNERVGGLQIIDLEHFLSEIFAYR